MANVLCTTQLTIKSLLNKMNPINLISLGLIKISGLDAEKFLQGQLTCDVHEVNEMQYCLGAHCNPKGRIQAIFRLFKNEGLFYFLLPKNLIAHLLQCLQKYAVFSKVKLEDVSEQMPDLQSHFIVMSHPEILQFAQKNKYPQDLRKTMGCKAKIHEQAEHTSGYVSIANEFSTQQHAFCVSPENAWQLLEIAAGIATIYPETIGEFTPHQLNLHLVKGISFNKGCYTGQEIVARMHYLGKLKQQMYRITFTSKHTPIPGNKLYNPNAQEIGTLVAAAQLSELHYQALAVIQNTAIEEKIHLADSEDSILTILDLPYTA